MRHGLLKSCAVKRLLNSHHLKHAGIKRLEETKARLALCNLQGKKWQHHVGKTPHTSSCFHYPNELIQAAEISMPKWPQQIHPEVGKTC